MKPNDQYCHFLFQIFLLLFLIFIFWTCRELDFEIIVVVENQTDPNNQTQPHNKEETRKKRAVKPRVTHIIPSNFFLDTYMTEWFRLTNTRRSRKRDNGRSHLTFNLSQMSPVLHLPTTFKLLIVLESKQAMKRRKISNKLFSVQLLMGQILLFR
jgi:hypothetical protein